MTDERVYEVVRDIPRGKVATYGQIAFLCGCAGMARRAAKAISTAPEGVPCHRVVRSGGKLAPTELFPEQRELLLGEGVVFTKNGCVDMRLCAWTALGTANRNQH